MLTFFLLVTSVSAFRFSSWHVGKYNGYPVNWDIYTHIHYSEPVITKNGTAICNTHDHFINVAHKHNIKVLWGLGDLDIYSILWDNNVILRTNYLNTIGKAMNDCEIDGIEIDYEYPRINSKQLGIITLKQSTIYSKFLGDLKKVIGPHKIVAADISIWGMGKGEWILGMLPWINVTMLNNGDFDYINTMSYHWSRFGSLWAWKKDAFFIDQWGIDKSRVNIGIPYFSTEFWNNQSSEPSWHSLSKKCPNIDYINNTCNDIVFIGKKMNFELGQWIKQQKFGGVFPWALNYDSYTCNNSLIYWLHKGAM